MRRERALQEQLDLGQDLGSGGVGLRQLRQHNPGGTGARDHHGLLIQSGEHVGCLTFARTCCTLARQALAMSSRQA